MISNCFLQNFRRYTHTYTGEFKIAFCVLYHNRHAGNWVNNNPVKLILRGWHAVLRKESTAPLASRSKNTFSSLDWRHLSSVCARFIVSTAQISRNEKCQNMDILIAPGRYMCFKQRNSVNLRCRLSDNFCSTNVK